MAPRIKFARFTEVTAFMTVRGFNLVVPLADPATAKRVMDTTRDNLGRSCAVSPLIDAHPRQGDVDSTTRCSTLPIRAMPGARTSATATRTTTTRTMSSGLAPSADQGARHHADLSFEELVKAYFDCRRSKRNTRSAILFEQQLEHNLRQLYDELIDGSYQPGASVCFVITRPKPREVWAATFRDRIVHHLLYNRISPRFHAAFIADSCACIPGRGTLYACKRLEHKIRSITQNWQLPAHYLKCDLANFFVSIDKRIVRELIAARVHEPWWLGLSELILFHDPRTNYELHGRRNLLELVPPHKRLTNHPPYRGLPIGNLSSQFFANILLDVLDKHVKHHIGARHYIRYVDDFILLHESPQWLNAALADIDAFLPDRLGVQLNPKKTILQPIDRGVDFVGQVIKPWRRTTRKRTSNQALCRTAEISEKRLFETTNSYFGLLTQASHSHRDRVKLARILLKRRGHCVNSELTKTYRKGCKQVQRGLNE